MPDLIYYLERNGFYPRREDIEAILRRMDHDANRQISYDEFCELTVVNERPPREEQAQTQQQHQSPAVENLEESKDPVSNVQSFDAGKVEGEELRQTNSATKNKSERKSSARKQGRDDQTAEEKQKQKQEQQEAAANERAEIDRQIEDEKARIQQLKEEADKREAEEREQREREREEAEQREAEERERRDQEEKERQVENFMFLRLVKLILKN